MLKNEHCSWSKMTPNALAFIDRKSTAKTLLIDASHFTWGTETVEAKATKSSKPALPAGKAIPKAKQNVSKAHVVPKVPDDTVTYTFTALNSYFLMLCDLGLESYARTVKNEILTKGLWYHLKSNDTVVDRLLRDRWSPSAAAPMLWQALNLVTSTEVEQIYNSIWYKDEVGQTHFDVLGEPDYGLPAHTLLERKRVAIMLLVLRYLKRYSPDGVIDTESETKFRKVNKNCKDFMKRYTEGILNADTYKQWEWQFPHRAITSCMRDFITKILSDPDDGVITTPLGGDKFATAPFESKTLLYSPTGSVQGVCRCAFCKAYAYSLIREGMTSDGDNMNPYVVTVSAVNKSWKSKRLIAPEDMYHAVLFKANEKVLDEALTHSPWGRFICLHDQTQSKKLAQLGSLNGEYSTIDSSSASDSISRLTLYQVMPAEWHRLLDCSAYFFKTSGNGQLSGLYTALTSGNGLTFICESLFFGSVCYLCCRLSGITDEELLTSTIPIFMIYGDDIVIRTDLVPLLLELLAEFGIKVNKDKSYWAKDFKYREACGGEYFDGVPVESFYWPRNFNMPETCLPDEYGSNNRLASLVALVNRFAFEEDTTTPCGNRAHQFLLSTLRGFYPKLQLGGDVFGIATDFVDISTKSRTKSAFKVPDLMAFWEADKFEDTVEGIQVWYHAEIRNRRKCDKPVLGSWRLLQPIHDAIEGIKFTTGFDPKSRFGGLAYPKRIYEIHIKKCATVKASVLVNRLSIAKALLKEGASYYSEQTGIYRPGIAISPDRANGSLHKFWYGDNSVKPGEASNWSLATLLKLIQRDVSREELGTFLMVATAIDTDSNAVCYIEKASPAAPINDWGFSVETQWRAVHRKGSIAAPGGNRKEVSRLTTERVKHGAVNKTSCPCHRLDDHFKKLWWDTYCYQSFLEQGPTYKDEPRLDGIRLNEVLKVSERRQSFESAYAGRESRLTQRLE